MNGIPYIMVLLAAMLWGTTGTAQNFISGDAHPLTIGAFRLMVGGFSLLLFTLVTKSFVLRLIPLRLCCPHSAWPCFSHCSSRRSN